MRIKIVSYSCITNDSSMEYTKTIQKIQNQIIHADNILVISHENPDADALGSLTAFSLFLEQMKKKHTLFCVSEPHYFYRFLPKIEAVKKDVDEAIRYNADIIVILDSGDLKIAGVIDHINRFPKRSCIINIDHHATNVLFGQINLVQPMACSTTEILYNLFCSLNIKISKEMAICLLAGIVGDTNNFTNQNTTPMCFDIVSKLLSKGALVASIHNNLNKTKTLGILKTWGKIFNRLTENKEFQIAYTVVTKEDMESLSEGQEALEGIPNYLNNVSDIKIAIVMKEWPHGNIRCSLRTNNDLIDVSLLAKIFGGGGHRKAAGFSIKGNLVETANGWQIQ